MAEYPCIPPLDAAAVGLSGDYFTDAQARWTFPPKQVSLAP